MKILVLNAGSSDYLIEKTDSGAGKNADRLEELLGAVVELQMLVSARQR